MNILGESKPIEVHSMFIEKSPNSQSELNRWIKRFPTVTSPLAISIEYRFIALAPLSYSQGDSQVIILEVYQVSFSTGMNFTSALIFTELLFSFPAGIIFESSSTACLFSMLSSTKLSILFATSSYFFFPSTTSYSSISTVDCDIKMESWHYPICAIIWVGACFFLFIL